MLDGQSGFALDLALEYEKEFGRDDTSDLMKVRSIDSLKSAGNPSFKNERVRNFAKRIIPLRIKRWLRKQVVRDMES
jgi:hypothetical protein